MKYADIETLNGVINVLSIDESGKERNLSLSLKNYLLKVSSLIEQDLKIFTKLKKDLYTKYGENITENDQLMIRIKPENAEAFNKEIKELLEIDSEVSINKKYSTESFIDNCDKVGIVLSFSDLKYLKDTILKDDE